MLDTMPSPASSWIDRPRANQGSESSIAEKRAQKRFKIGQNEFVNSSKPLMAHRKTVRSEAARLEPRIATCSLTLLARARFAPRLEIN